MQRSAVGQMGYSEAVKVATRDSFLRPTIAEMLVFLQWALMINGHALACDCSEGTITGDAPVEWTDGATFGPLWWAIPADKWHQNWKVAYGLG